MENVKQLSSFVLWRTCPKTSLWNALWIFYFCMDCWGVSFIAVHMMGLWSACFIFSCWIFIVKNLLEAVCKCSPSVFPRFVCFLQVTGEYLHQNITWLQGTISFHLFVPRDSEHLWKILHLFSKCSLYLVGKAVWILCIYLLSCR